MNSHWSVKFFRLDYSHSCNWDQISFVIYLSNSSDQIHRFLSDWISCNKFLIYLSTWSSSNHHRWIVFLRFFISLRTTIESMSTRKFSLKRNWILLLRIVFSSTNSSIICSFNEKTTIMKIMFCNQSFITNSKTESQLILINWISKFEKISEIFVTFTTLKSIIISYLIVSKSTSCWT
jgi:hypothetical protein